MRRDGCIEPGWSGQWVWSRNGQETGRNSARAEQGRSILGYNVRQDGCDWKPINQTVHTTPPDYNFGGQRTFFLCLSVVNGKYCGRQAGKLFFVWPALPLAPLLPGRSDQIAQSCTNYSAQPLIFTGPRTLWPRQPCVKPAP